MQDRLGNSGGASLDRYVWMPLRAYERAFGAPRSLQIFAKRDRTPAVGRRRGPGAHLAARRARPGPGRGRHLRRPHARRGPGLRAEPVAADRRRRWPHLRDGPACGHRRRHQHRARVGHDTHARDRRAPRAGRDARQILREVLAEVVVVAIVGGVAAPCVGRGSSSVLCRASWACPSRCAASTRGAGLSPRRRRAASSPAGIRRRAPRTST